MFFRIEKWDIQKILLFFKILIIIIGNFLLNLFRCLIILIENVDMIPNNTENYSLCTKKCLWFLKIILFSECLICQFWKTLNFSRNHTKNFFLFNWRFTFKKENHKIYRNNSLWTPRIQFYSLCFSELKNEAFKKFYYFQKF